MLHLLHALAPRWQDFYVPYKHMVPRRQSVLLHRPSTGNTALTATLEKRCVGGRGAGAGEQGVLREGTHACAAAPGG